MTVYTYTIEQLNADCRHAMEVTVQALVSEGLLDAEKAQAWVDDHEVTFRPTTTLTARLRRFFGGTDARGEGFWVVTKIVFPDVKALRENLESKKEKTP